MASRTTLGATEFPLSFKLDGDKRLLRKFKKLALETKLKLAQRALVAAEKPLKAEMRERAADRGGATGNYERSIASRLRKYNRGRTVVRVVGVDPRIAPHGHLIEFGTVERFTKAGAGRGVMPEYRVMTKVWEAMKDNVLATMKKNLVRGIEREAKKNR